MTPKPLPAALASIKRFHNRVTPDGDHLTEHPEGDWVDFADVAAAWPQPAEGAFAFHIKYPKSMPLIFSISCPDFVKDKARADGIKRDVEKDFDGECVVTPLYTAPPGVVALRAALRELVNACDEANAILTSDAVIGVFQFAAAHNYVYKGPTTDTVLNPVLERARTLLEGRT